MDRPKNNSPAVPNHSWRLLDDIDFIEAQFTLADFCLNRFPEKPQLARSIQNAESVPDIRHALQPIINLIYVERDDLANEFALLIHQINQTTN